MASKEHPIRVAITGGGLAGTALAGGLLTHPHLRVQIFESAPRFSERGAAVGIGANGLKSLKMMGPAPDGLRPCIDRAGGVENKGGLWFVGSGPAAGTQFHEMLRSNVQGQGADESLEVVVHRAQMLAELLRGVPDEAMFVSKRLERVDETPDELVLRFTDGSTARADVLVGADGIHGVVRGIVLGAEHPATAPVFSGCWDARNVFPLAKGVEYFGAESLDVAHSQQHDWCGADGFWLHDIIDDGRQVHVACAGWTDAPWPAREWKRPLARDTLLATFGAWKHGPRLVDAMLDQPEPAMFSEWVHRDAPAYARGRVVVLGDAAHAMLPFQASGATQSLEDAMVLSALLGRARSVADVPAALEAYDAVRRPRSQAVVHSSAKTAMIVMGRDPDVGVDPDKLRDALKDRWNFILHFDLEKHRQEALQIMEAKLAK